MRCLGHPYMKVHLDRPAGGTVNAQNGSHASHYTYTPDDVSVGDVDGDGVYELFVKWMPSNAQDNSRSGFTGPTIIDCYRLDGTRLWRVDLGHNIRSGNHYTQFMVYDFDGDGCAEMICKTAPGTKDGKGNQVLLGNDKPTDDYRHQTDVPTKSLGRPLGGSEYLTCFSGKTGEALSTIPYRPAYDDVSTDIWGDNYGNRSERYLAGVAYLDGLHPRQSCVADITAPHSCGPWTSKTASSAKCGSTNQIYPDRASGARARIRSPSVTWTVTARTK